MEFTPITEGEFRARGLGYPGHTYRPTSLLAREVSNLKANTGFSTPCIWRHNHLSVGKPVRKKDGTLGLRNKVSVCRGSSSAHQANMHTKKALNEERSLRITCHEGTLYVFRIV